MTNQLLGALELGLVYGLMVLGVYITFRILKIPDLTVDGSVTLGMAICAMVVRAGHPFLAIILSAIGGAVAGSITAFLQTKVKIPSILAGILTMTGLYSINLLIMNKGTPNISIIGNETIFSKLQAMGLSRHAATIIGGIIVCAIVVFIIEWFFSTHTGLCILATGDNEEMINASSVSAKKMKWIALAIANTCVAISGAMYCQYMGYADVTAGAGTIVVGFASVIIGETICVKKSLKIGFVSAIVGSVVYRILVAIAIKTNLFPTYFLKFVSVVIIVIALAIGPAKRAITESKNKSRRLKENA